MSHEWVMAHFWYVCHEQRTFHYAKDAWTPFCATPTGQSVRTAGSRWRAAAWCRVTQSPVKTPSCAVFAHEHILSRGAHICSARGESIGNVATTAQRNAADAPDIGCCSVLQRIAMCCSVLQCVAANPELLRRNVKYSVKSLLKTKRRGEGKENMILRCVSNIYVLQAGQERRRRKNVCRIWT